MRLTALVAGALLLACAAGEQDLVVADECLECAAAADENVTAEEVVDSLSWDEINGTLRILHPSNGTQMPGTAVAVRLNVNTNCVNATRFQHKFNGSNVCLSLDSGPLACWPLFSLSRLPLFVNLSEGNHTLTAMLVDPDSGLVIDQISRDKATFETLPAPEIFETQRTDEDEDTDAEEDTESPEHEAPKSETIPLPRVGVVSPAEQAVVPQTFSVALHVMTESNLTQFRRLFQDGYICLALDGAVQQTCWPVFEEAYSPRFAGLEPGAHVLQAFLSHPNTLEIIPGTGEGVRSFWVVNDAEAMAGTTQVPLGMREPSKGSAAFDEQLQRQAAAEDEEGEGKDQEVLMLGHSAQVQNVVEEKQEQQQQQQQQQQPVDVEAPSVTLQVNVDGTRHELRVMHTEDAEASAARFCVKQDILGQGCVRAIAQLVETERRRAKEVPHIELFSPKSLQ